ncbi:hypothetical protein NW759_004740 [Fusarium solani]|uniref:Uncharacterized protein n=1 Tax=Fusarium solani TaxID=169388 RepID=A0A9P9RCP0_FUSSL|nr:uncharacterized protein B0J15DRAFT_473578 [Fusarium solani]KAH7274746.1 hypothetical protein B0J15DRAFT_473578 [Fusarium solani]KAJ4226154.1 hypothetical protein NW759_004740 [Fusarium solani]
MKTTTFAVALLGLFPAVMAAESLAPSPTESVGCEPHGDHWHCEAARTTLATAKAPATTDEEDHDDHDHEAGESEALAPSPTESVGCEPHGDHWHCEAARTSGGAAADAVTSESVAAATTEEHDHSAGATESLAPSPTESVGCEPHGDHWHCEGPATGAASGTPTSSPEVTVTNAAGIQMVPVVGLFAAAVLAL